MRRRPVTLPQNYALVQRLLSDEKKAHRVEKAAHLETQRQRNALLDDNAFLLVENGKLFRNGIGAEQHVKLLDDQVRELRAIIRDKNDEIERLKSTIQRGIRADEITIIELRPAA